MRVVATAWTGGGETHFTEDAVYVEKHRVPSLEVLADGTGDLLEVSLKIAADWREVKQGSSTAFPCTSAANVVFRLFDVHSDPVDCWASGPEPEIWSRVEGVGACATR